MVDIISNLRKNQLAGSKIVTVVLTALVIVVISVVALISPPLEDVVTGSGLSFNFIKSALVSRTSRIHPKKYRHLKLKIINEIKYLHNEYQNQAKFPSHQPEIIIDTNVIIAIKFTVGE